MIHRTQSNLSHRAPHRGPPLGQLLGEELPCRRTAKNMPQVRVGARALLLWLCVLLFLAVPLPSRAEDDLTQMLRSLGLGGQQSAITPEAARKLVDDKLQTASKLSGLPIQKPVPVQIRERGEVKGYIQRRIALDTPPPVLAGIQGIYRLLGLLPAGVRYEEALLALATAQVAAWFDPETATMNLIRDIPVTLQAPIVVHELVHALQDQNHPLQPQAEAVMGEEDRGLGLVGLIEGQATLVMMKDMMEQVQVLLGGLSQAGLEMPTTLPELDPASMAGLGGMSALGNTGGAPDFMARQMMFPYVHGAAFCQTLEKTDPTLKGLWTSPPRTAEQILHPSLYLAGEEPLPIGIDSIRRSLPRGVIPGFHTTLGEWNIRVWLEEVGRPHTGNRDNNVAVAAATGWGGDRALVLDEGSTLLWVTRWDTPDDAAEFAMAAARAQGCEALPVGDGGTWGCPTGSGRRKGSGVVLVMGTQAGADRLLDAGFLGIQ